MHGILLIINTYSLDEDISQTAVSGPFRDTIFELFQQHLIVRHNHLNFTEHCLALIRSNNSVGLKRDQIHLKIIVTQWYYTSGPVYLRLLRCAIHQRMSFLCS